MATEINTLLNKHEDRVVVIRTRNPVSTEDIEQRFKNEAPRMIWLALFSGEFFRAFAMDLHFDLGMKGSILKYARRRMNEEALHILAACNHSIHVETVDTLKAILDLQPLDIEYSLHFPEDPILSRVTPIIVPITHGGIPIDDNLKESFIRLLEQAFSDGTPFQFHNLPKEFQKMVNEFHVKHISDLSNITTERLKFLTSLPVQMNNEIEVKLPEEEVACRRLVQILPESYSWLINKLIVQADTLLETWLKEHSGTELLFRFNTHFYKDKDDLVFHSSRLSVLSKFIDQLPAKNDLLSKFFEQTQK